ncbi:MAG: glutamyl-tRNA reductase, partial [Microcystaceae cyanobacterium]
VNRSHRRSEELAAQFPQATLTLALLPEMFNIVAQSDIVFTSTSATEPILNYANLSGNLTYERQVMLVDISVPRNVDADVQNLPHVTAYNVDDLKAVVAQNQASRRKMAQEAEGLLEEEVEAFELWWRSLE